MSKIIPLSTFKHTCSIKWGKRISPAKARDTFLCSCRYVSFDVRDLPDTFDWRDKNVVSSVKDQGSAGTCWAFSTVGNVEGQWVLAGHPVVSLATEQLVDCDATIDPDKCEEINKLLPSIIFPFVHTHMLEQQYTHAQTQHIHTV